jgi:hypothetical protein
MIFNIYCDESCHLENDHQKAMVMGAICCPNDSSQKIFKDIREIKKQNGLNSNFEIKWTKVSNSKSGFYLDLAQYFFSNPNLSFRAIIVPDKSKIDHKEWNQTHDDWYFKMYFEMLKTILNPNEKYRIYLDIKDTRSAKKIFKFHEILSNNLYDFSRSIIERIQTVRSHEIELLQLADLIIGAISYENRGLKGNLGKETLIQYLKQQTGYSLTKSTLLKEPKFNLFRWYARNIKE